MGTPNVDIHSYLNLIVSIKYFLLAIYFFSLYILLIVVIQCSIENYSQLYIAYQSFCTMDTYYMKTQSVSYLVGYEYCWK